MTNDWSEKHTGQMRDFRIPPRCRRYLSSSGILRSELDVLTLQGGTDRLSLIFGAELPH
jgi:hypothetical protein